MKINLTDQSFLVPDDRLKTVLKDREWTEVTQDEEAAYARYLELVEKYHLSNEKAKTKYHRFLLCLNHLDVGEK